MDVGSYRVSKLVDIKSRTTDLDEKPYTMPWYFFRGSAGLTGAAITGPKGFCCPYGLVVSSQTLEPDDLGSTPARSTGFIL